MCSHLPVPAAQLSEPVADYMDQQFKPYFRDESGLNRTTMSTAASTSSHLLATGTSNSCLQSRNGACWGRGLREWCSLHSPHRLRSLGVGVMRALHQQVNIMPLLGKAASCEHVPFAWSPLTLIASCACKNIQKNEHLHTCLKHTPQERHLKTTPLSRS